MKSLKGISEIIASILMLVITISLAGTAYYFISGVWTTTSQGIEVVDSSCNSSASISVTLRNVGTGPISNIACNKVPTGQCIQANLPGVNLQPGQSQTFTGIDTCYGTGGRLCNYRLIPSLGKVLSVSISCTANVP